MRTAACFGFLVGATVVLGCSGGESGGVEVVAGRNALFNTRDVAVAVISPQPGEVVRNPVQVELVLMGFELGTPTTGAESRGIRRSDRGQHLHLIVDDEPYRMIHDISVPITLDALPPGPHSVRVIPALAWHESVKGPGSFEATQFYVDEESGDARIVPGAPLLTYLLPSGTYAGADADSILLDFHLRNARMGPGGYEVRLTVDGNRADDLEQWVPHYLVGLDTGNHTIRLQLRDPVGRIVPGTYNTAERTIRIER